MAIRFWGVIWLCLLSCATAPRIVAAQRPNVLVILADDLGSRDLQVDGSTFHETTALDSLASQGVRLTNFYSSHSVCSPTRAALMTGKAPQRVGITDWIHPASGVALPTNEQTLGEAFRDAGYQTAYFGKWHLGEADADQPTHHGFEQAIGVNRVGQPASYYFPFRRQPDTSTIWDVPNFEQGQPNDYLTDVLTQRVTDFLRHRDTTRPFMLCLGHYAVHTPIEPPIDLADKFRIKRASVYHDSPTPTAPAPFDAISRGRQDSAEYAAMVASLDLNVGRLLQTLAELGLDENTIVVFTSDNGGLCTLTGQRPGPTCNLPWRAGKGWLYEGGIRVTCLIRWPSGLKPATVDVPGYTADLYPTLLELCDLPARPEQCLDGRSLARALRGEADRVLTQRSLAWYYPHDHGSGHRAGAALRHGNWKLVRFFADNRTELYDLKADPGETLDVSREHPQQLQSLAQELDEWIASTTPDGGRTGDQ